MGVTVEMDDNVQEIKSRLDDAVDRFLEEAGAHIEGEAKTALSMHPPRIDTGLLRNSITYAIHGQPAHKQDYGTDGRHRATGKRLSTEEMRTGTYNGTAPETEKPTVYIGTNVEYAP